MEVHQIDDDFFVSPQIVKEDIEKIVAAGFKAIICNRPDYEESNQPQFSDIKDEAEKQGIQAFYLPVTPPQLEQETITNMINLIGKISGPVLAYCRSGTRSAKLYQIAKSNGE